MPHGRIVLMQKHQTAFHHWSFDPYLHLLDRRYVHPHSFASSAGYPACTSIILSALQPGHATHSNARRETAVLMVGNPLWFQKYIPPPTDFRLFHIPLFSSLPRQLIVFDSLYSQYGGDREEGRLTELFHPQWT